MRTRRGHAAAHEPPRVGRARGHGVDHVLHVAQLLAHAIDIKERGEISRPNGMRQESIRLAQSDPVRAVVAI